MCITCKCQCDECLKDATIIRSGESAYEIAKKHGFVGTEKQWVRSLKATVTIPEGVKTYDTITELNQAIPGGSKQPVWVASEKDWYVWDGEITTPTKPIPTNPTPTEPSPTDPTPTNPTPSDTTPPVLTITTGGNFTTNKTITMSTNETATIYYSVDNSAYSVYTSPITITDTKTFKAYATDTAGNSSQIQTVTYTKEVATSSNLFNKSAITPDSQIASDGNLVSNTSYCVSDWVKVKPNTKYSTNLGNLSSYGASLVYIQMYKADKVFKGGTYAQNTPLSFTTATDVEWVRMTVKNTIINEFVMVEGNL